MHFLCPVETHRHFDLCQMAETSRSSLSNCHYCISCFFPTIQSVSREKGEEWRIRAGEMDAGTAYYLKNRVDTGHGHIVDRTVP
jgi:hypothetical protein